MIDEGTNPNFTLYFDGNVIPSSYNSITLSGSTGVLYALPLGLHLVTIYAFNLFGAVTVNDNFTIDDPVIGPESTVSAVETVSQQIHLKQSAHVEQK